MDEKLPRIRQVCSILFIATRIFFYAALLYTGFLLVYSIILMFISSESFTAIVTSTGLHIHNDSIPIRFGAVIPNNYITIVSASAVTVSAKWLNIINLLSDVIFFFTPLIFMLHYAKDTFFNVAYGNRPFTKESSFNLKVLGVIIVAASLFCVPIKTLSLSFVTGNVNVLLYANLSGLMLGILIVGLSYLFEYIQDVQDANVVLVQVLQDDVEKEMQQEQAQPAKHTQPQPTKQHLTTKDGAPISQKELVQGEITKKTSTQEQPTRQLQHSAEETKTTQAVNQSIPSNSRSVNDLISFGQDNSDISHVFDEF